jgi:hypothetical protein
MITPKLPLELWNLIYNIKRAMESNDHWGWAGAVSRADITEDMCDAPYPRDRPGLWWRRIAISPMLRRSVCWMWALRIYQFQYKIDKPEWQWAGLGSSVRNIMWRGGNMRVRCAGGTNMPEFLSIVAKAKDLCCWHIYALRMRARYGRPTPNIYYSRLRKIATAAKHFDRYPYPEGDPRYQQGNIKPSYIRKIDQLAAQLIIDDVQMKE